MAPKPNKAFVKIGCMLTPLTAPNCAYYKQGEAVQKSARPDVKDYHFCAYFNRNTLACMSKVAACNAMMVRMKEFGYHLKPDNTIKD